MGTTATKPGPLIGSGRSADVFEYGEGLVLRRYRRPRDTNLEVAAMEHVRAHGFPVPAARALGPTDIVMDRVQGRVMLDDLGRRPWLAPRHAATLAALHDRLHAIPGPSWLPAPAGEGEVLLHLDLHPDNVVLGPAGPVVIDWSRVARGPAEVDVALTWLVLAYSVPSTGLYRRATALVGRRAFLALFLRHFERSAIVAQLGRAGTFRLANPDIPAAEHEAVAKLLDRFGVDA
jgi:aminoglycoside phosphotransferase (APT) family kinase protein